MSRYIVFTVWVGVFYIGGLIGHIPSAVLNYGAGAMLWGIISTNWCYGTRNETGLPFFNPTEEK